MSEGDYEAREARWRGLTPQQRQRISSKSIRLGWRAFRELDAQITHELRTGEPLPYIRESRMNRRLIFACYLLARHLGCVQRRREAMDIEREVIAEREGRAL
jgi:hypothetical protein